MRGIGVVVGGIVLIAVAVSWTVPVPARDAQQWMEDTAIAKWFKTLMQPDNPMISCCGDADAYEADSFEVEGEKYVAIITGYRAVKNVPIGTRIVVPSHKLKYDAGNPTGHGIIFLGSQQQVFCYVTPGGI